jgi:nitronate monooxygenase
VATSPTSGNILRYQANLPTPDATGDLDAMALWAGQGVGLVHRVQPAADIVGEIWAEARSTLGRLRANIERHPRGTNPPDAI